ncbi:MAG: hypothetical protein WD872_02120 [Pirellulaceae bacterium]
MPLSPLIAAEPRIEIEVCTERGFPIDGAGKWAAMLGEMGLSHVRIRSARGDDAPNLANVGTEAAPSYRLVGILTSDGRLHLPKGKFGISDKAKLANYFDRLKGDGIEAIATKPQAFGLLGSQLVTVHEALATPVSFATSGKQPRDVARQIAAGLPLKFVSDTATQRAMSVDRPVADELQGLSSGTALAAVLRPLGLVMFPEKHAGALRLRIADSRAAREHWPVGWPPKQNPGETMPALFKFLNVEIAGTPLGETLQAIGGRLDAPIVIDYNALARLDIDLATKKVELPKTNTFYGKALDRILFPAGLKYEVRVDEADKPFVWISGVR